MRKQGNKRFRLTKPACLFIMTSLQVPQRLQVDGVKREAGARKRSFYKANPAANPALPPQR
jgi:hypothetical protein